MSAKLILAGLVIKVAILGVGIARLVIDIRRRE